jgi:formamidopyrimidine-DNA glycosylase
MPELPEVETVVRSLNKNLLEKGNKIIGVSVSCLKILKNASLKKFKEYITNESLSSFERKGKYIIAKLTHKKNILIHLRMEGKLFLEKSVYEKIKSFLRIQIKLNDGYFLNFYDSRKFGTFHIYDDEGLSEAKELTCLGYDVLSSEFNEKYLSQKIKGSNKKIKTLLLDQHIQCGIGNIYSDEILFASRINPLTIGKDLNSEQIKEIVVNCKKIMKEAIKEKGTSINTFLPNNEEEGKYQNKLMVYHQKYCKICNHPIVRVKINGRSSFYCPFCQK